MKKRVLTILFCLLWVGSVWAFETVPIVFDDLPKGQEQVAVLAVVSPSASLVPASSEAEETLAGADIFSANWAAGSDELNTGGGTNHVFSDSTGEGANFARVTGADVGIQDSSSSLIMTDCATATKTLNYALTQGTVSMRFGLQVTDGWAANDGFNLVKGFLADHTNSTFYLRLLKNTNYYLRFVWYDTAPTGHAAGSDIQISLNTWYQVHLIFQKNVASNLGTIKWKVCAEDGTGCTEYVEDEAGYTSRNNDTGHIDFFCDDVSTDSPTLYIDSVLIGNSTDYRAEVP